MASRNTPYLDELSSARGVLEDLWQTFQDADDLDEDARNYACSHIEDALDELDGVGWALQN